MLASIKEWLISVIIAAFIINIVDLVLPNSKLKPYITLVMNFIFVFIIITPVINVFSNNMSFEDKLLKYFNQYNQKYIESMNDLSSKTGTNSLSKGYEESLKSVLNLKLEEYGYEIEVIKLDENNNIENLKIKEKNSNKSQKEDIQSSKDENLKQVFKDKDDANIEDLKEDLNKILDIEIETIQID